MSNTELPVLSPKTKPAPDDPLDLWLITKYCLMVFCLLFGTMVFVLGLIHIGTTTQQKSMIAQCAFAREVKLDGDVYACTLVKKETK